MDLSKNLTVIIVFLMMWKEASNQEISSRKDLNERSKRYHESDRIHTKRLKHAKVGREKKNILTDLVNQQTDLKTRNGPPYIPGNKANKVISPRQIVRIKPAQGTSKPIRNNQKPFVMHVPQYGFENKSIDETDEFKANETLVNDNTIVEEKEIVVDEVKEVKEKEQIEDTVNIENKIELDDKNLPNTPENPLEQSINTRPEELEIVKKTTKLHSKKHKSKETYDKEIDKIVSPESIKDKSEDDKLTKTPAIKSTISPENSVDEIKIEKNSKSDEKKTFEIIEKDDIIDKSIKTKEEAVILKENGKTPKRHPFLDAIQNDRYITCPANNAPLLKDINETKTKVIETDIHTKNDEVLLKNSAKESPQNRVDITQDNDEDAEVIIKNKNFEEVMVRTPHIAPKSFQNYNSQNGIAPESYVNDYQTPCNYYQPRTQINRNYNHRYAPDEQRTVETDGNTVVSYNNYFKLPNNGYYNDRNDYNLCNNRYYGYPTSQSKDGWKYGRGYWQTNGITNERIWRSWKNTEYYIKSKNALKKIDSEQLNNLINQNNFPDKAKFMEKKLVNGNYRNQNNLPYL